MNYVAATSCKRGCLEIAVLLFWCNRCIYGQNFLLSGHLFGIKSSDEGFKCFRTTIFVICTHLHTETHPCIRKVFKIIASALPVLA